MGSGGKGCKAKRTGILSADQKSKTFTEGKGRIGNGRKEIQVKERREGVHGGREEPKRKKLRILKRGSKGQEGSCELGQPEVTTPGGPSLKICKRKEGRRSVRKKKIPRKIGIQHKIL